MNKAEEWDSYRTMVLGTEGAGKTVFLASMYQHLSIQQERIGFYLATDTVQHQSLIQQYQTIRDPLTLWPPSTIEVETWNFRCRIARGGKNFEVLHFDYYDYPGELLYETQYAGSDTLRQFKEHAANCNTWLFILDGHKIKALLSGMDKPVNRRTGIMQDLDFMLPSLQNNLQPTHFVITKWDLLDETLGCDGNCVLQDVRRALMNNEKFASITKQLVEAKMPARLLPVSAVGKEFIRCDADGEMVKIPGTLPQPYQVEVPIAFILLDAFHASHTRLSLKQRKLLRRLLFSPLLAASTLDTDLLKMLPFPVNSRGSRQALSLLVRMIEQGLPDQDIAQLEKEQHELSTRVRGRTGAMKSMVLNYAVIAKKLMERFPSSYLSGEV